MLCLIAVCSILKFAIMPPSYARVIIHTMNDKDENYDTIVLGASHMEEVLLIHISLMKS